jgi:hypothetical protein
MTVQSPKSRFLPTLTEVVHSGHVQRSTMVPEPASAGESLPFQTLAVDLELELRGQLQAMLNAQIQQALPQLHAAIDTAVKQAVSKAIAQHQLGER